MPRVPLQKPKLNNLLVDKDSLDIDDLGLMPNKNWYLKMENLWSPGEIGAQKKIDIFIKPVKYKII